MDKALETVKRGKSVGAVYFPKNFTAAVQNRRDIADPLRIEDFVGSEFDIHLDMSGKLLDYMVGKYFNLYKESIVKSQIFQIFK